MVSVLDFRLEGWWFEPGLYVHPSNIALFSSVDKELHPALSVFTQVNKWVPATSKPNKMMIATLFWMTIPSRGQK